MKMSWLEYRPGIKAGAVAGHSGIFNRSDLSRTRLDIKEESSDEIHKDSCNDYIISHLLHEHRFPDH